MPRPTMVIVLEGGLIQDIFADGEHEIVIIDHDGHDESVEADAENYGYVDERYNEFLDAHVWGYGTCPLKNVDADVMEAVCKHMDLENPNATNGATPPQDSQ